MSAILENPDEADAKTNFRLMTEADLDNVIAIEESVYSYPWTRSIFHDCLVVGHLGRVLETNENIVAYSVMSVAVEEAHLLTLVVSPSEQGKGYGKEMLNNMIHLAVNHGAKMMYLEVRTSNKIAIELYEKSGFNELGIRNNYYPAVGGREDALIMARDLSFI